MSNEARIEKAFTDWMLRKRIRTSKLSAPERGFPDQTIWLPNCPAFIEFKDESQLSSHQIRWLMFLEKLHYPVLREPRTVREATDFIEGLIT